MISFCHTQLINIIIRNTELMSFRQQNHSLSYKKPIRHQKSPKVDPLPKNTKSTNQTQAFKLFQSGKLLAPRSCKEVESTCKQKVKISQKVFTTDESNNQQYSNMHESNYVSQKLPNEQYFQQPLNFKPKNFKGPGSKRQIKTSVIQNLNAKATQMHELVRSQDKELKKMKNSISEQELHRLVKMHSIEKLKLLQTVNVFKNSALKNVKK